MRGIILLCLLHVAVGQLLEEDAQRFSWDGPSDSESSEEDDLGNACLQSKASCGCCLMQRQMRRMEWFFNYTTAEIKKEITKTKTTLDNVRASRSAFSVTGVSSGDHMCYGPFAGDAPIIYRQVFINLGGNYNVQTGIFTVPLSGVYSLSITIYATHNSNSTICAQLQVNGQVMATLLEHSEQDGEDSGTIVMAKRLEAGDQVAVILPEGCVVCEHTGNYNTFTGFLLYPAA